MFCQSHFETHFMTNQQSQIKESVEIKKYTKIFCNNDFDKNYTKDNSMHVVFQYNIW